MEKRYVLEIEFKAKIDEVLLMKIDAHDPIKRKAKLFISEFIRHKKLVLAFFKNYIIDEYLSDDNEGFDVLSKKLEYMKDYKPLFLMVAQRCRVEIRREMIDFIIWAYKKNDDDTPESRKREDARYILEAKLSSMKLLNARLVEV